MARILHIIQQVSRGGGARATIYLAHYSSMFADHQHTILSLVEPDPSAVSIAESYGVRVLSGLSFSQTQDAVRAADIIQVSFWNNTEIYDFFRSLHVPTRLIGWFHVGGQASPQVITPKLADYFDRSIACSPYTALCPALQTTHDAAKRAGLVYGATDLGRVTVSQRRSRDTFNVGYTGTLDFLKMHRNYVAMSARVNVPNIKFVVCGAGGAVATLQQEAINLGVSDRFLFKGYIEDISAELSELDVYGYPLCPDTYAASEMNLQEVMYAGIPSVVFPYGGIRDLVRHNETALVVQSEEEYAAAIEYLYKNPRERERIGSNARKYALSVFGAHNAGRKINDFYDAILKEPKKARSWDPTDAQIASGQRRVGLEGQIAARKGSGAYNFIESLGDSGAVFLRSMIESDPVRALRIDEDIRASSEVLKMSGISPYRNYYTEDSWLEFWEALANWGSGLLDHSLLGFVRAVQRNPSNWRACWYLVRLCDELNQQELGAQARMALQASINALPEQIRNAATSITLA